MSGSVTYQLRERDVVVAARRHSTPTVFRLRLGVIVSGIALVAIPLVNALGGRTESLIGWWIALLCILFGLGIFLLVLRLNYVGLAKRAFASRPAMSAPMTLDWDDRMLRLTTSGSQQESPMAALVKYGSWPDMILLYPTQTDYIAVPTRDFTEELLADLRAALTAAGVRKTGRN